MRKNYFAKFILSLTLFITSFAYSQVSTFEDNFDTYIVGKMLACQNNLDWNTWNLVPCDNKEDPYISDNYSLSGTNSLVIADSNDLVKTYGNITSGICEISFHLYIPAGKSGYFNTMAGFTPNALNWAMQCWFDANGNARLDAEGASSATFTYNHDTWQKVRLVVDLEFDIAQLWFENSLVKKWQWTRGWNGTTGSSPLRLDATDFFGATANDEMYVDDFSFINYPKIISTATGGDWSVGTTWVGGNVPTSENRVEIAATAIINLDNNLERNEITVLLGELNCGNYIVSGTGDFNVSSGSTLSIGSTEGICLAEASGNIQLTGTRTYSTTANYIYNGSSSQATGDGLSTFNNLNVDNAAGITLTENKIINGTLTLTNGNINTSSTSLLTIGGTGIISGGNSSSFINGPLARIKNTSENQTLIYPVGKDGSYRPLELNLTHTSTDSSTYTVEVINSAPQNLNLPPSLDAVSTIRYWNIEKSGDAGVESAMVTLFYDSDDGVTDPDNTSIAKEDGSDWMDLEGTVNGSSIISTNLFTSFGNFVLANTVGGNNALPVELSSFSAIYDACKVILNWITQTEVNNYGFEIERISGKELKTDIWQEIGFVRGHGNSNSIKEYSFIDNKLTPGEYFYRLKQIDSDGSYSYSKEVSITVKIPQGFTLEQNYPNPFNPVTKIVFNLPKSSFVVLNVYDALGNLINTIKSEDLEAGVHKINFDGSKLSSGIYYYKFITEDFAATRKMVLLK